jgi:SAM-dependent methyltransferase
MTSLSWASEPAPVECRVCGFVGTGTLCAQIHDSVQPVIQVVRCPECESVMLDVAVIAQYTDESTVDDYVESAGSIDAIARNLFYTDPTKVGTFLDVGSHYGFGLHVAREILGWNVVGVEPGVAARRGAVELELDIRDEFFSADSQFDTDFDLILASEVLEHVPDPVDFLAAVRSKLAEGGHAIFTTPAAEAIAPTESMGEALVALSPGDHVFLASAKGVRLMMQKAGWTSIGIERQGRSLRAIGSDILDEHIEFGDFGPTNADLIDYYDRQAEIAPAGSALASGMASRHFRAIVDAGRFDEAEASRARAVALIRTRSGLDLDDPDATDRAVAAGVRVPWNAIPVAYSTGMMNLAETRDPARSARYLRLAVMLADARDAQAGSTDGDSSNIRLHAAQHLVLANARSNPARLLSSAAALSTIDSPESVSHWVAMAFTELLVKGDADSLSAVFSSDSALSTELPTALPPTALDQLLRLATVEYGAALERREYRRAAVLASIAAQLGAAGGPIAQRRRIVLALMRRPRLLRAMRAAFDLIPLRLRSRFNPLARL